MAKLENGSVVVEDVSVTSMLEDQSISPAECPGVSFDYVAALIGRPTAQHLLEMIGDPDCNTNILAQPAAARIDFITAWKLLHANVTLSNDETHRLGSAPVPNGNFELLMASMIQGETLGDGLRRLAAGAQIVRPDLMIGVSMRNGEATLTIGLRGADGAAAAIYVEAMLVVIHCALQWAMEHAIEPRRLRGPAMVQPFGCSLLGVLGTPVQRQGDEAQIVYRAEDVEASFHVSAFQRWHEAAFGEYVRLVELRRLDHARSDAEVASGLLARVRACLLDEAASQTAVARRLGMSVPTLRRRLAESGLSFRRISSDLRREAAEMLLLGDKPAGDIAEELGMSDSRCFRRACNGWFGVPPSEVRRSLRRSVAGHGGAPG
ncbi:AraC family transcriptional regulator [Sphingomonas pruni]|uniref:AraC family transcriptional regulator n=1 Tax=Sphingomonas pruni TaxID=40683 RepID=UPI0008371186|nr:AraC family transcriptional regulator [Sphingomonas pruni]